MGTGDGSSTNRMMCYSRTQPGKLLIEGGHIDGGGVCVAVCDG